MTNRAPVHASPNRQTTTTQGAVKTRAKGVVQSTFPSASHAWSREPLAGGGALHRLLAREMEQVRRPAVLLCHGFVQGAGAFGVPTRSLVHYLLAAGFAPFVLELPVPRKKHPRLLQGAWDGLSLYTNLVAPQGLQRIFDRHLEVAWLGHSMGGVIGASLPEPYQRGLSALVTIGAPLLPAIPGGRHANRLFMKSARALSGAGVALPGKALARQLMRIVGWLDRPGPAFPLQLWHPRSLSPAELAFSLSEGFEDDSWSALADLIELGLCDGETAGPLAVGERIRAFAVASLVIAADRDGLVPLSSSQLLFERLGSATKEFFKVGAETTGCSAGHIDLLLGAHAEKVVWPRIREFLSKHMTILERPTDVDAQPTR